MTYFQWKQRGRIRLKTDTQGYRGWTSEACLHVIKRLKTITVWTGIVTGEVIQPNGSRLQQSSA